MATGERPSLEPGELIPDGSGRWATVVPGSPVGKQMLRVFAERTAREKASVPIPGVGRREFWTVLDEEAS